ncbi:steroid delta-isomerase, partial [Mycobacterium tuberculosis variant microti]
MLGLHGKCGGGFTKWVRGVFPYRVNKGGLNTNKGGYWKLEMVSFGNQE